MARKVLFAVVAYAVLALVVVGWGWLLTHPLQGSIEGTDDDVSRWFAGERTSSLDPVAEVGTLLGETPVGLAVGAVVAVVAGLALRAFAAVLLVALASAGDGGIYWLGSHADPRDRPPVRILDPGLVPTHSFPSGHVGTAVAVYGGAAKFQDDPHWRDHILFYEYFHGDNGAGLGASHQTGWTGLVARMMHLFANTSADRVLKLGKAAAARDRRNVYAGVSSRGK